MAVLYSIARAWNEAAAFMQMARAFGMGFDEARPRVVLAFP